MSEQRGQDEFPSTQEKLTKKLLRLATKKAARERLDEKDLAAARAMWSQCHYYVSKKKRLCSLERCPNSLYCGTHRPVEEGTTKRVAKRVRSDQPPVERIPCPLDPNHTIFKHNLGSHLKICNVSKDDEVLRQSVYFCQDCNTGSSSSSSSSSSSTSSSSSSDPPSLNQVEVKDLVMKIQTYFETYVESTIVDVIPPESELSRRSDEVIMRAVAGSKTAAYKTKHAAQDAALVSRMRENCLLSFSPSDLLDAAALTGEEKVVPDKGSGGSGGGSVFVELGAGKGLLSLAISCVQPRAQIVLVERMGLRYKVDRTLGEMEREHKRLRMDIRHTSLQGVLESFPSRSAGSIENAKRKVVVVAKHLCGVATDYALRALGNLASCPNSLSPTSPMNPMAQGAAIATCCHHACNLTDFCGAEHLINFGFSPVEFETMTHWSGWAALINTRPKSSMTTAKRTQNGVNESSGREIDARIGVDSERMMGEEEEEEAESREDNDHSVPKMKASVPKPEGATQADLVAIGRQVKRVLDHGRVLYLRSLGFDSKVVRYCSPELSPECYAIIATQPQCEPDPPANSLNSGQS